MKKAFFFDRDGIVNVKLPNDYVKKIEEFSFIPEFFSIFEHIKKLGYIAILTTNQQGIGKGLMTDNDLIQIHEYMQSELKENTGFLFDDIYYCPDLDFKGSFYRKPMPGMIVEAISKWNIDRGRSWIAGDSITDVKAGRGAGIQTILVGNYNQSNNFETDYLIRNLPDIIKIIMA